MCSLLYSILSVSVVFLELDMGILSLERVLITPNNFLIQNGESTSHHLAFSSFGRASPRKCSKLVQQLLEPNQLFILCPSSFALCCCCCCCSFPSSSFAAMRCSRLALRSHCNRGSGSSHSPRAVSPNQSLLL